MKISSLFDCGSGSGGSVLVMTAMSALLLIAATVFVMRGVQIPWIPMYEHVIQEEVETEIYIYNVRYDTVDSTAVVQHIYIHP